MSKSLVIVESPAKAKTIRKYLNSLKELKHLGTFDVKASMGHITDLKKKTLGIEGIENSKKFKPEYEILQNKEFQEPSKVHMFVSYHLY